MLSTNHLLKLRELNIKTDNIVLDYQPLTSIQFLIKCNNLIINMFHSVPGVPLAKMERCAFSSRQEKPKVLRLFMLSRPDRTGKFVGSNPAIPTTCSKASS